MRKKRTRYEVYDRSGTKVGEGSLLSGSGLFAPGVLERAPLFTFDSIAPGFVEGYRRGPYVFDPDLPTDAEIGRVVMSGGDD